MIMRWCAAAFAACWKTTTAISVVAEASDGPEAVRLALELRPQVIVMDCALPEFNGIEATRRIRKDFPRWKF